MTARDAIDQALREEVQARSDELLGMSFRDALKLAAAETRDLLDGKKPPVETPWPSVNCRIGGGLHQRRSYVLVGGTGAGKSQFAIQLALHAAKAGTPVGYFSAELDEAELALRLLGVETGMRWSSFLDYSDRAGAANRFAEALHATDRIHGLPIHFFGRDSGIGLDSAADVVRDLRGRYPATGKITRGPVLIICDYLQVFAGQVEGRDQLERVSNTARLIKDACLREHATALILSATSRENSKILREAGGKGGPGDLVGCGRDSSEVEFSADGVFVLASAPAEEGQPDNGPQKMFIGAAKLRMNRPCWLGPFYFDGGRFDLLASNHDEPAGVPATAKNDRAEL